MDYRSISPKAEDLALFTVNTAEIYRKHAQPTMTAVAAGRHSELALWKFVAGIGAVQYGKEIADAPEFGDDDITQAALYIAEHYRDELRDVHGVDLPTLTL